MHRRNRDPAANRRFLFPYPIENRWKAAQPVTNMQITVVTEPRRRGIIAKHIS
ncbi:MAG: hypothetical protein GY757_06290 [bacterium]|nr:hypothetical protein [bacterium]